MKTRTAHFLQAAALALSAGLLAGCGGGDASPPAAGTFDVQGAITAMFETPATFNLSGSLSASQTGSVAVELHETDTFAPGAPPDPRIGGFPGTQLTRAASPPAVPIGATAPTSGTEIYYYTRNPFRLVARIRDGLLERFTVTADLPSAATIGQSGPFATFAVDQSASTDSVMWKLEAAEPPGSAWACLVFVHRQISQSQCVRVAANGAITGARVVNEGPLLGLTVDLRSP